MLLYKDLIADDELFSDAFPMKVIDDIVIEVDCQMILVKEGDVDIGANPSAEEQEEALENGAQQVNNVIHSFRLVQVEKYDKSAYTKTIKAYMKSIKAKLEQEKPDRVQAFEKGAATYFKKIIGRIGEYDFYLGESMNADGMLALLDYREDGITPYFTFWKDGLKEQKL